MLNAAVAALACLSVAQSSPAAVTHAPRTHLHSHVTKELSGVLASIEERLRSLDTISSAQALYARRLDVIQDKLDRVETTISLRLERAQLAADRLEHRLHMLQSSVQASIEDSSKRIEQSQDRVTAIALNLTAHLDSHRHLLAKVNGAYVETWRRGLTLENLVKDSLSIVNITRRELADGLRSLARRQRDSHLSSTDLEAVFKRRINDNTNRIELKMEEMLDAQKQFIDSCQRVQLDDPTHVADVIEKLIDSLINKTASTFRELQNIQTVIRNHDTRVVKIFNSGRVQQSEVTCRRLESAFRNVTQSTGKENELNQLTEKFVALTNRADAALQRLEARLNDDGQQSSDVTAAADKLLLQLNGIKNEEEMYDDWDDDEQDAGYSSDTEYLTEKEKYLLRKATEPHEENTVTERTTTLLPRRRHLHKHPYDRGPTHENTITSP